MLQRTKSSLHTPTNAARRSLDPRYLHPIKHNYAACQARATSWRGPGPVCRPPGTQLIHDYSASERTRRQGWIACLRQLSPPHEVGTTERCSIRGLSRWLLWGNSNLARTTVSRPVLRSLIPKIGVTLFDLQRTALWTPRETMRRDRSYARAKPRK